MGNKDELLCLFYKDEIMVGADVKAENNSISFSILQASSSKSSPTFINPEIAVYTFWGGSPDSLVGNLNDAKGVSAHVDENWNFSRFASEQGKCVKAFFSCIKDKYKLDSLESISFTLDSIAGSAKEGEAYVRIEFYEDLLLNKEWELYIKKVPMEIK